MIILGLTGSIGMGKSEAARMLRRSGVPVFDSDSAVHRLLGPGGAAVETVEAAFPGVRKHNAIDRRALGARVFGDAAALERLEGILHPYVTAAQRSYLCRAARGREHLVALEIPLLFETAGTEKVDYTAVVSAPYRVQRHRILARPGMDEARLTAVLARQMPDGEKRRRADYVLAAGNGKRFMLRRMRAMLADLLERSGRVWPWPPV